MSQSESSSPPLSTITTGLNSSQASYFDLQPPFNLSNQTETTVVSELAQFLFEVYPENWNLFFTAFSAVNFTVDDILIMKCCQLTPLFYTKDMVYVVRFWNKLENFKLNSNCSKATVVIQDTLSLKLLDILTWGIQKEIRGAIILKGLFSSNTCKGLSKTSQSDITNIIIRYLVEHNVDLTDDVLKDMAFQIDSSYNGESQESYFSLTTINNKTLKTGRLVNKKYNIKRGTTEAKVEPTAISKNTIVSLFSEFCPGKCLPFQIIIYYVIILYIFHRV